MLSMCLLVKCCQVANVNSGWKLSGTLGVNSQNWDLLFKYPQNLLLKTPMEFRRDSKAVQQETFSTSLLPS